jgi:hypothetical protein
MPLEEYLFGIFHGISEFQNCYVFMISSWNPNDVLRVDGMVDEVNMAHRWNDTDGKTEVLGEKTCRSGALVLLCPPCISHGPGGQSVWMYGGQSGTGTCFSPSTSVFPVSWKGRYFGRPWGVQRWKLGLKVPKSQMKNSTVTRTEEKVLLIAKWKVNSCCCSCLMSLEVVTVYEFLLLRSAH